MFLGLRLSKMKILYMAIAWKKIGGMIHDFEMKMGIDIPSLCIKADFLVSEGNINYSVKPQELKIPTFSVKAFLRLPLNFIQGIYNNWPKTIIFFMFTTSLYSYKWTKNNFSAAKKINRWFQTKWSENYANRKLEDGAVYVTYKDYFSFRYVFKIFRTKPFSKPTSATRPN